MNGRPLHEHRSEGMHVFVGQRRTRAANAATAAAAHHLSIQVMEQPLLDPSSPSSSFSLSLSQDCLPKHPFAPRPQAPITTRLTQTIPFFPALGPCISTFQNCVFCSPSPPRICFSFQTPYSFLARCLVLVKVARRKRASSNTAPAKPAVSWMDSSTLPRRATFSKSPLD